MDAIFALLTEYWPLVSAVVTFATAVTAFTPTTADNAFMNYVLKVFNFVAGNVLKNKNADDV